MSYSKWRRFGLGPNELNIYEKNQSLYIILQPFLHLNWGYVQTGTKYAVKDIATESRLNMHGFQS